nr:ribonuclease H-like domain-containing protein [Tanacetum cinerariifolium]
INGVNTVGQTSVSTVEGNRVTVVKTSAGCVWRPKITDLNNVSKDSSGSWISKRVKLIDPQGRLNTKGGIGKIRTNKIDFKDVFFVKELKFNLFSVSQMCDKKNSVLFTESECLVLCPDFKLIDESQVLLRVPRQNNMYSFDLKNVVPSGDLTCLFAKATIDESNIWHRRMGHVNFKIMNKLVKGNLVRGLPSKTFEDDHTCVACQKEKQHKASCKFDGKPEEGFLVGYSINNKAFRSSDDKARDNTADDAAGKEKVQEPVSEYDQALNNAYDEDDLETNNHSYDDESVGAEADFNNMEPSTVVSHIPTIRVHYNYPRAQIIRDPMSAVQTRELKQSGYFWPTIEEEVYVSQPPGFVDPKFPEKVYKVEKALYGLHQAPIAWYKTLSTYMLDNGFHRGQIDKTLFIKRLKGDILLVQIMDYGYNFMQTKIHVDNESAICVIKNPVYHSKTKHIKIRHHFIRDSYEKKLIEMVKIYTNNNVADLLTKAFDMMDYGYNFMQTKIHVDNESAICVIKNPVYHSKTKHVKIRHHFIRDSYEKRLIEMVKIYTNNNVADLLTKAFDVGDEVVHKELGDIMKRAAVTASSLEAKQDSEQFWQTAALSTIEDGVMAITATIDRNVKVLITEASIRRHLKLGDSEGLSTLSTEESFQQLALMSLVAI